jgi:hypothetical protein
MRLRQRSRLIGHRSAAEAADLIESAIPARNDEQGDFCISLLTVSVPAMTVISPKTPMG